MTRPYQTKNTTLSFPCIGCGKARGDLFISTSQPQMMRAGRKWVRLSGTTPANAGKTCRTCLKHSLAAFARCNKGITHPRAPKSHIHLYHTSPALIWCQRQKLGALFYSLMPSYAGRWSMSVCGGGWQNFCPANRSVKLFTACAFNQKSLVFISAWVGGWRLLSSLDNRSLRRHRITN